MGLDLYAGTLTRFHTGAWETEGQRVCREAGIPLKMVYAEGQPPRLSAITAPIFVSLWRRRIRQKLKDHIKHDLRWSEASSQPYYTRKPDHDGLRALALAGAYAEFRGFQPPTELPQFVEADPAYAAAGKDYLRSIVCMLECHMFLPSPDSFVVPGEPDVVGGRRFITSTGNLARALDLINWAHWQADEAQIAEWSKHGAASGKVLTFESSKVVSEEEIAPPANPFEHTAQFGFAIYHEALKFSRLHNVPILTDE